MSGPIDAAAESLGITLSLEDRAEVEKFCAFLRHRAAHPDEPMFVSYAEFYGETVYEALAEDGEVSNG